MCISINVGENTRQMNSVREGKSLRINVSTTYDANFPGPHVSSLSLSKRYRLIKRTDSAGTFNLKSVVPRHHDIGSSRQGPTNRFPCPPPHDDRFAQRQRLETLEIGRQPPWHVIITSDNAIFRSSNNDRYNRLGSGHVGPQTAIGALIVGSAS